jgi:hypothetical protein
MNYSDGELEVRKTIRSDIDALKDNLREQDFNEMKLMGIESIENALLFGFESPESECFTVVYQGKISAMFGVVPSENDDETATIWMLSSNEVRKFPKRFLKLAKEYIDGLRKQYETLWNFVHPSNTLSLKLLEILRAEFRWGFNSPKTDEPFILFLI